MSSIPPKELGNISSITKGQETLLDLLQRQGIVLNAACGGNGTCGKCKVQIRTAEGIREVLACQTQADGVETIYFSENPAIHTEASDTMSPVPGRCVGPLGAAVDLGTTTVYISLHDLESGRQVAYLGNGNAQASYGADVISRIHHIQTQSEGLETLSKLIRTQIAGMLAQLLESVGSDLDSLKKIHISGNTIMQHILMGISPVSMAAAPYTPETLFLDAPPARLEEFGNAELSLSPCIAAYVGGDITAGMLEAELDHPAEEPVLFLDVGTNGEMAIRTADGILTCAVASGPAFEGAEIRCGMTAARGAISGVKLVDGRLELEVLGRESDRGEIRGICGSGLLELLAVLLEAGIVDETGRLLPPEELLEELPELEGSPILEQLSEDENGNGILYLTEDRSVYFCAGDVRKLQLAKAAIAAGIQILLQEAGVRESEVDTLYLAGGFGEHIDPASAAIIGMIPEAMQEKIRYLGNASLKGSQEILFGEDSEERLQLLCEQCKYIELSGNPDFNEEYIEQMSF